LDFVIFFDEVFGADQFHYGVIDFYNIFSLEFDQPIFEAVKLGFYSGGSIAG
jgi:hypothetical protein